MADPVVGAALSYMVTDDPWVRSGILEAQLFNPTVQLVEVPIQLLVGGAAGPVHVAPACGVKSPLLQEKVAAPVVGATLSFTVLLPPLAKAVTLL